MGRRGHSPNERSINSQAASTASLDKIKIMNIIQMIAEMHSIDTAKLVALETKLLNLYPGKRAAAGYNAQGLNTFKNNTAFTSEEIELIKKARGKLNPYLRNEVIAPFHKALHSIICNTHNMSRTQEQKTTAPPYRPDGKHKKGKPPAVDNIITRILASN